MLLVLIFIGIIGLLIEMRNIINMSKGLEKELDCLIAAKNNLWTAALGSFGGSFGLAFSNIPLIVKAVIVILGFSLSVLFFDKYLKKGDRIDLIIKVLKKRGD